MGVCRPFGNKNFWRLIPRHRVGFGQHFVGEYTFLPLIGGGVSCY